MHNRISSLPSWQFWCQRDESSLYDGRLEPLKQPETLDAQIKRDTSRHDVGIHVTKAAAVMLLAALVARNSGAG